MHVLVFTHDAVVGMSDDGKEDGRWGTLVGIVRIEFVTGKGRQWQYGCMCMLRTTCKWIGTSGIVQAGGQETTSRRRRHVPCLVGFGLGEERAEIGSGCGGCGGGHQHSRLTPHTRGDMPGHALVVRLMTGMDGIGLFLPIIQGPCGGTLGALHYRRVGRVGQVFGAKMTLVMTLAPRYILQGGGPFQGRSARFGNVNQFQQQLMVGVVGVCGVVVVCHW